MKTIGLIGGTSWESTAVYYRLLNEGVRTRRGGLASASLVLLSLDFAPLAAAMAADRWDQVEATLVAAARRLEAAGADAAALCTNTMHKLAAPLASSTALPFVDIRDVTGQALQSQELRRPLLLATRTTMEQNFYRDHLKDRFAQQVVVPDEAARDRLHAIIFDELCLGVCKPGSKAAVLAMVADAQARHGCDSLVFGCTEIGLLFSQDDTTLPVLDTTALHCAALLDFALSPSNATSQAA
ncbi:amino acid racemase [Lichenihabitans sp. Uapishka_5]|uniref:aspartate/glutamate racemase family protein n=1 Tax=Lichenihabitans sp. Uapishka_5 TaxID=3037302 RepID=UPI0029E7EA10|nr:amino acid racemase [Lichenihabitans sp. Uapishka_5]MDX7951108.1 amino acid racemase [Lichenihabitans sp. Uapishka_5]